MIFICHLWVDMPALTVCTITSNDTTLDYKHSKPNTELLTLTSTATTAFQKNLDFVGPIETDVDNNQYILTLQCELSKFIEAYPITNKEAITVANSFFKNCI